MKTTDLAKCLATFLTVELPSVRNVSPNTVLSYRDTFKQLLSFMEGQKGIRPERLMIRDLTKEVIISFLEDIESAKGNSISTRNQRLAAIHALFRYIQTQEPGAIFQCQQVLSIPFKKQPGKTVRYLTEEEMSLLLSAPDQDSRKGRRDLAILCLLYDSAARVQELADLRVKDVRLSAPAQVMLTGKGRKTRIVPLMKKTVAIIENYLKENGLDRPGMEEQPLFRNPRGEKLTRQGIAYILKKYTEECQLEEISPHRVRHSKAMHLTEADVNPFFIRDFLGHSDIKTTGVYAKASLKMKKAALDKLNDSKQDPMPMPNCDKSWTEDQDLMQWLSSLGK